MDGVYGLYHAVLLPWDTSGSSSLSALLVETKGCLMLLLGCANTCDHKTEHQ